MSRFFRYGDCEEIKSWEISIGRLWIRWDQMLGLDIELKRRFDRFTLNYCKREWAGRADFIVAAGFHYPNMSRDEIAAAYAEDLDEGVITPEHPCITCTEGCPDGICVKAVMRSL